MKDIPEGCMKKRGILFTDRQQDTLTIAGLSLQERMIRTLQKAGISEIFLLPQQSEEAIASLQSTSGPVVCLTTSLLLDPRLIEEFLDFPAETTEGLLCVVPRREQPLFPLPAWSAPADDTVPLPLFLCPPPLLPLLVEALQQGVQSFPALFTYLQERTKIRPRPNEGRFWYWVRGPGDVKEAEDALFQTLVKETDSPITRLIARKISLRISRLLMSTPITPNQITLFCLGIGLIGAFLFTIPHPLAQIGGALLFLLSTILDGCDGEIARLKFLESRYGGWLDLLCDNVVHVGLFLGIAIGLYRQYQVPFYLLLGGLAVFGVVASVATVCYVTLRRKKGSGPFFTSVVNEEEAKRLKPGFHLLVKINDLLARRDFSYLLVLLALLRKMDWFLWGGAIGSNLFFFSLLGIYRWGRAL
ncbi:MAG: CDP-alcohol phosphatidyltransferase family protein [Nitrospinota bacterium]|nr:MAG: CDP-alcohol phosphatidyltransferase family protein [Nitrospinota bacterium]